MIKNVYIIINYRKKQPVLLGKTLIQWFIDKGINIYAPPEDGEILGMNPDNFVSYPAKMDCAVTLGGDGTFLRAARMMAPLSIPILGINMGTLGFLTEIEESEVSQALEKLIGGEYYLEERTMLEAKVLRDNQYINRFIGLNDIVIAKGSKARVINLELFVDEEFVTTYKSDGLIISSPTGSTAYSLSAGGPIAHPEVNVTFLTPICPHTLQSRPMVIPDLKTVTVSVVDQQSEAILTIDGQDNFGLCCNDKVIINKALCKTSHIRTKDHQFFSILREKLKTEGRSSYE